MPYEKTANLPVYYESAFLDLPIGNKSSITLREFIDDYVINYLLTLKKLDKMGYHGISNATSNCESLTLGLAHKPTRFKDFYELLEKLHIWRVL